MQKAIIKKAKEKMTAKGWTYDEVAKHSKVSIYAVHAFFKGRSVSTDNMFAILTALGLKIFAI